MTAPVRVSPVTRAARNGLYADAVNESLFMRPGQWLTRALVWVDNRGVDGAVNGLAATLGGSSSRLGRAQTGVVRTMAGRRRLTPNLTSRNFQMRAQAERESVNMPIQGTAADILKKAMIDLHAELPRRGINARMILTVHDELLFECERAAAEEAAAVVRELMENAVTLSVPLTVDVGIADNWRDAKS